MATITIRIEDSIKNQLYHIANEIGISVSSMFNAYAKDIIRKKRISFGIDDEYHEDQEMYANAESLRQRGQKSLSS